MEMSQSTSNLSPYPAFMPVSPQCLQPEPLNEKRMATQIFVNLPVKDLNKSIGFFTRLGFSFNVEFTDEKATCMVVGENIFVMLLVEEFSKPSQKKRSVMLPARK
jgi:hypothetical protein